MIKSGPFLEVFESLRKVDSDYIEKALEAYIKSVAHSLN